jgi:hypothetical protein
MKSVAVQCYSVEERVEGEVEVFSTRELLRWEEKELNDVAGDATVKRKGEGAGDSAPVHPELIRIELFIAQAAGHLGACCCFAILRLHDLQREIEFIT